MKLMSVVLAALLSLIQYPLWLGDGSWRRVWEVDRQLAWTQAKNAGRRLRNDGLEAEARDLVARGNSPAVEELARYDLGMVRKDELFVQFSGVTTGAEAGSPGRDLLSLTDEQGGALPATGRPAGSGTIVRTGTATR